MGKATGIDLWQGEDLAGNSPAATRANAEAEGFADRADIQTGNARQLPFADASFDVVLSNAAMHNIDNLKEIKELRALRLDASASGAEVRRRARAKVADIEARITGLQRIQRKGHR